MTYFTHLIKIVSFTLCVWIVVAQADLHHALVCFHSYSEAFSMFIHRDTGFGHWIVSVRIRKTHGKQQMWMQQCSVIMTAVQRERQTCVLYAVRPADEHTTVAVNRHADRGSRLGRETVIPHNPLEGDRQARLKPLQTRFTLIQHSAHSQRPDGTSRSFHASEF